MKKLGKHNKKKKEETENYENRKQRIVMMSIGGASFVIGLILLILFSVQFSSILSVVLMSVLVALGILTFGVNLYFFKKKI